MTRAGGHRYATLALVMFGLACGDGPTAPNGGRETVHVSLEGLTAGDAGVVLRLVGALSQVESAGASLEVAWVAESPSSAIVVIVGSLSERGDALVVRRPTGQPALRAEVGEVASADGAVTSTSSARAIVRAAAAR